MSQLDLASAAEVSARHISFLETARSGPSREMVLVLAETLSVPLRDRNAMLRAAGFPAAYPEPGVDELLVGPLGAIVDVMLAHHEPLPMLVVGRGYEVVRANLAAGRLLALLGVDVVDTVDLVRLLLTPQVRSCMPRLAEVVADVARRLQREVLHHPLDDRLAALLAEVLDDPAVADDWRRSDPASDDEPMLGLDFAFGDQALSFVTAITSFSTAASVTLDELRIESWFARDEATAAFCAALAGANGPTGP